MIDCPSEFVLEVATFKQLKEEEKKNDVIKALSNKKEKKKIAQNTPKV